MGKLRVVKAVIRRCTSSDLGQLRGRGWVVDVPLDFEAGEMEVSLKLSASASMEGDFIGYTLPEARRVARALGCLPVVRR